MMIDNSPGTVVSRNRLYKEFPGFFSSLEAAATTHPASYHIGVITSDLGAGPYTLNQGQCHPDGDGGKLQIAPAPGGSVVGDCTNFTLGGGVRFIDYDQIHGTSNAGAMGVPAAFDCIGAVGGAGCGFEHQLESVYRALHDPPAENAGFLRDDALLVVVLVTDEDDCSATPDDDLFDPSPDGIAKYGTLHSFRCTEFGIGCGNPTMQLSQTVAEGPFDDCRPLTAAEGGKLIDVGKYIDFLARPGGVKADASDVIVVALEAPPSPVSTIITMPCADQVNTASCPILANSCTAGEGGAPPVRLATVVRSAYTSIESSVCDDYAAPLDDMAQKIIARLK